MKNVSNKIYALFVTNFIFLCSIISLEYRKLINNDNIDNITLTLPYQCDQDEYNTTNYDGDQVQLLKEKLKFFRAV